MEKWPSALHKILLWGVKGMWDLEDRYALVICGACGGEAAGMWDVGVYGVLGRW